MEYGIMLTWRLVSRVDSLQTHIEAKDEEIKIKPYSQAISDGYLFVELVEL